MTQSKIDRTVKMEQLKNSISDAGRRRHLVWGADFDTRSMTLTQEVGESWEEHIKEQHRQNSISVKESLVAEFGERYAEAKIENFIAIGTKPFSILSYHNSLYHQIRQAFVIGAYYPALLGACALGERMLNHLLLDLRGYFTSTAEYKSIYKKKSFDDWRIPIEVLESWKILEPEAVTEFRSLMPLRNRSIHFNMDTYGTLRDDALAAILHMRTIIEKQFGMFGLRPWTIPSTKGHTFIKKEFEYEPFLIEYYLPHCPFVGHLFAMRYFPTGWQIYDLGNYGDGNITDDEFADAYNNRLPENVVNPEDCKRYDVNK